MNLAAVAVVSAAAGNMSLMNVSSALSCIEIRENPRKIFHAAAAVVVVVVAECAAGVSSASTVPVEVISAVAGQRNKNSPPDSDLESVPVLAVLLIFEREEIVPHQSPSGNCSHTCLTGYYLLSRNLALALYLHCDP